MKPRSWWIDQRAWTSSNDEPHSYDAYDGQPYNIDCIKVIEAPDISQIKAEIAEAFLVMSKERLDIIDRILTKHLGGG